MKLTINYIETLLNKKVLLFTEQEFRAMAALLDWETIKFESWDNAIEIQVEHEKTQLCIKFTRGQGCFIHPVGYPKQVRVYPSGITLMELICHFRHYYCREYSVSIYTKPKFGYKAHELQTIGNYLTQAIFA